MYTKIIAFLERFGSQGAMADFAANAVILLVIGIICVLSRLIAKEILLKIVTSYAKKSRPSWDDILLEKRVFQRLSHLVTPIIIALFAGTFPKYEELIMRGVLVYTVAVMMGVADALINAVDEIYRTYEISKVRPMRGLLQIIKVAVFIIGFIVIIAGLIGESPLVLLGGIGAMTAVTTLVFKDSILGFVAGIQMTSNDMIRIGDWIEMPKYAADGIVIDLSLNTVKVENFDKTITFIPAYALVSDAFKNWRGMQASGGRRIKRAIYIDAGSVNLCSDAMIERFRRMELLKDYIEEKLQEVEEYNLKGNIDLSEPVNGRRLTNIGTFREYMRAYLKRHPGIHKEMTLMVRQLPAEGQGIPLEIYAFANTVQWVDYEGIQSDIFDHLFAAAPRFGLSVFQQPSGQDIRSALENEKAAAWHSSMGKNSNNQ
ncbi:mechanosensitive ion channel family protein [Desulforamulus ruminis]|uniref:Mechanosensing system component YbdG n=1 Tax=Desulforamulus ruminis (strain ATCC 23193 / DSM 2154 / NCIMB 8452 / DL) TaxID=696281 RepID=F6DV52_DESRL|nr:mechanosensitive ion channel domain-containing protein [Desulforamulus ruminis]AEG59118.1 MscS Mechanosensitive ion channel [Desulforamulus ruminis DSM 2154]